jgi:hypothetical protein
MRLTGLSRKWRTQENMAYRVGVLLLHQVHRQGHREEITTCRTVPIACRTGKCCDTFFKYLDWATKVMDIPNARKKKLYSKLHLQGLHNLQNLVSQRRYLEGQKPTAEARERIRGRQPPFLPQIVHRGRPVNRPTS